MRIKLCIINHFSCSMHSLDYWKGNQYGKQDVLYKGKSPKDVAMELMTREKRSER